MTIKIGASLPEAHVFIIENNSVQRRLIGDVIGDQTAVLVGLPGAFTPSCHLTHLPEFVERAQDLTNAGVEAVFFLAVTDVFVMQAWSEARKAGGKITMISDGNGDFTAKAGMRADLSSVGMGWRSKRYAAILRERKVVSFAVEEVITETKVSSAAYVLQRVRKLGLRA